jgi:hypothetical protein
MEPFAAFEDGRALAQAIVDIVREPLLVLDKDLRVIAGDGRIVVAYVNSESGWTLSSTADNGVGKPHEGAADASSGLSTSIVQALAKELDASVDFASDRHGTTVSIKHATAIPAPRTGD